MRMSQSNKKMLGTGQDAQSDRVYVCMCVPQGDKKMPRTGPEAQSDHVYVCASGRQEDAENWARYTV